jgi:hypothetical protein
MFLLIFPYWWPSFVCAHDHVITRNICLRVFRAKIRSGRRDNGLFTFWSVEQLWIERATLRRALIFISPDENGPQCGYRSLGAPREEWMSAHKSNYNKKQWKKRSSAVSHRNQLSVRALVGAQGRRFNLWSAHAKRGYQAVRNERCSPTDRRRLMPKFNFLHTPWEDVASIALGHRK